MNDESRIRLVEQGLLTKIRAANRPPSSHGLAERMAHYIVPGVSIAVVDDGQIAWARGYGLIEAGRPDPVTPETLFQAASISKPVAALAALQLVPAGVLDLDADVNTYLRSWQVPPHEWAEKVTLRRLLSHTAGMSVPDFPGYAHDAPVPTLVQVLNGAPSAPPCLDGAAVAPDDPFAGDGRDANGAPSAPADQSEPAAPGEGTGPGLRHSPNGAPPANTAPIRVVQEPGRAYAYSGGGYTVVQQLLEDVTGRPFAGLLYDTVLRPAGMVRSALGPLSPDVGPAAATGHRPDGVAIPGRWHTYPELAAAGLWTTPSDLARFALAVRDAWLGAPDALLPQPLAREMLRRQLEDEDLALGPIVFEDGGRLVFGHNGSNEGYRGAFWLLPHTGQGVAVMTNSDNGEALVGEIVRAVAAAYAWPPIASFHVAARREVALVEVDPAVYGALAGTYRQAGEFHPPPDDPWAHETIVHVTVDQGRLRAWLEGEWGRPEELLPESESRYVTGHRYTFEFSPSPPLLQVTDPWGDTVTLRQVLY